MFPSIHGDPITTEDGFGILCAGGRGVPTSRGDGVFLIMADGIGGSVWAGTGSPPTDGDPLGCIGIMGSIISGGLR